MRTLTLIVVTLSVLAGTSTAQELRHEVGVSNLDELRGALREAKPGSRIRVAPGKYDGISSAGLKGTAENPVVIEAADPKDPPVFVGPRLGIHLSKVAHVTLRNLVVDGPRNNGINIDDGGVRGEPSHHLVLENIVVRNVGPRGNRDSIKLSGVDDFVVRNCVTEGWGGSAIDMVGCHKGLIEDCRFVGKAGSEQSTGVQAKGGSSDVVVRKCAFTGDIDRGVNLGGSTGMPFFRPVDATYEAKDVVVEGCRFEDVAAPICYASQTGGVVRFNTIENPKRYAVRILQDSNYPGFVSCEKGRFENNVVVFDARTVRQVINVGANTRPETFTFAKNVWYARDVPGRSRPSLPVEEEGGVYGVDPQLKGDASGDAGANAFDPRGK